MKSLTIKTEKKRLTILSWNVEKLQVALAPAYEINGMDINKMKRG